jgi:ADP-ribose pyrophosphatase
MLSKITAANQHQVIQRAPAKLKRGPSAKQVFAGEFFRVWQWPQELYDGSLATFESLSRPDTVTILAFDSEGKIIMTKQSQPGFAEFWSLPGGVIDEGEEVFAAAKRELLEETGFASDDWYFLFCGQMNSRIDWANFHLVARNCRRVAAINPDAGEKIQVELVERAAFADLLRQEKFRNGDFALWWWRGGEEKLKLAI